MSEKKIDRRVKYTKQALRESLLELMKYNSINKITVTQICEKADINRGTFYSHYSSPLDLLKAIEHELFLDITSTLERNYNRGLVGRPPNTYEIFLEIFECILENADICKILLGEHGDAEYLQDIINIAKNPYFDYWADILNVNVKQMDYLYSYVANGCIGMVRDWIVSGMKETPRQLADLVDVMTTHGLSGFAQKS